MQLSKMQNEYIVNATHRWNIKSGAVRSGKSFVDTAFVIPFRIRERAGKPGLNVILGVSKESIERNVLQPMREIYTDKLVGNINNRNIARVCGEDTGQYGGELTEEQFRRVIVPVSAHIRRITFDRADRSMEEVQHAACACCDLLYADQAAKAEHQGREVASENTDGYSVSYVQEQGGKTAQEILAGKIYQTAALYLEPTGLLNMGVYDDADQH